MQSKIQDMVASRNQPTTVKKSSSFMEEKSSPISNIGSTTELEIRRKNKRKQLQLQTNISSATKRYCTFLFVSLDLDKEKDVFEKRHFTTLLKKHPSIFDAYLVGFHTYVWRVDADNNPEFTK